MTARHIAKLITHLGAIQVDAVNVLVRSHYLAVFSRLGAYPTELFEAVAYRQARMIEYFRLPIAVTRARVRELVEDGTVVPASVEGWNETVFLLAGVKAPVATGAAFLSPFDSLLWDRARVAEDLRLPSRLRAVREA